jgi:hypothetical protein
MTQTSARRLRINNPDLANSEKTYLDADYASGTTITVQSNVSFAENDIIVIGEVGQEKTEGGIVSSVSSDKKTITLDAALNFSHTKGIVVYRAEYNFVDIDVDMVAGSTVWAALSQSPIQWDRKETIYIHQGGVSGYNYRFKFRNSATGNYSEYSPTITGAGFAKNTIGYMIQEVRKSIIDPDGNIVSNSDIIRYFNAAKDIINGTRNDWWFWLKEDTSSITTVDGQKEYNLDDISTHIEYIKYIKYNYNDGTRNETWHLRHLSDIEYDYESMDGNASEDDEVAYYNLKPGDSNSTSGYFRVWPVPATDDYGTFHVRYYEPDADYSDIADTTAIPMPELLINYAIFLCEQLKGNNSKAKIHFELFFGAQDKEKGRKVQTGIAALEAMQRGKLRPLGQPRSLKTFRGRRAMQRFFGDHAVDADKIREDWFDYPRTK